MHDPFHTQVRTTRMSLQRWRQEIPRGTPSRSNRTETVSVASPSKSLKCFHGRPPRQTHRAPLQTHRKCTHSAPRLLPSPRDHPPSTYAHVHPDVHPNRSIDNTWTTQQSTPTKRNQMLALRRVYPMRTVRVSGWSPNGPLCKGTACRACHEVDRSRAPDRSPADRLASGPSGKSRWSWTWRVLDAAIPSDGLFCWGRRLCHVRLKGGK